MTQLTAEQLIKIILGIVVVVAVAAGVYLFFRNQIIDFFKNLSAGNPNEVFMVLAKWEKLN
jgi:hypothetical protein